MAKLVDAPHSKCGGFGHGGSSPPLPINLNFSINRRSGKIVKTQTNSTTKEVLAVLKGIPEAYTVPSGQCR